MSGTIRGCADSRTCTRIEEHRGNMRKQSEVLTSLHDESRPKWELRQNHVGCMENLWGKPSHQNLRKDWRTGTHNLVGLGVDGGHMSHVGPVLCGLHSLCWGHDEPTLELRWVNLEGNLELGSLGSAKLSPTAIWNQFQCPFAPVLTKCWAVPQNIILYWFIQIHEIIHATNTSRYNPWFSTILPSQYPTMCLMRGEFQSCQASISRVGPRKYRLYRVGPCV